MNAEFEKMIEEMYENTSQGIRRKQKKIGDLDYFQCLCGVAMRGNSLKTHWRSYCRLTQGMPELLKSPFLKVPVLPISESLQGANAPSSTPDHKRNC
jgi:hypothetical protein